MVYVFIVPLQRLIMHLNTHADLIVEGSDILYNGEKVELEVGGGWAGPKSGKNSILSDYATYQIASLSSTIKTANLLSQLQTSVRK